MIKIVSKLLLPIAMVFAALFGVSWGEGNPQYWYLFVIFILFLLDMGITFVLDKVTDFNFYKDVLLKLLMFINNKRKNN